jgi:hypothetical protein
MKRLSRSAGKRLVLAMEGFFGDGPYARIERLDQAVRGRQEQVEQLRRKVNRQQREIASLRRRLSNAEGRKRAREHLVDRETWDTTESDLLAGFKSSASDAEPRVEHLLDAAWGGWWEYGKDGLRSIAESSASEGRIYEANLALAELSRAEADPPMETHHLYQAVRCRLPRPPSSSLLAQLAYLRIEQGDLCGGLRLADAIDEEVAATQKHILISNARMRAPGGAPLSPDLEGNDGLVGLNRVYADHGLASVRVADQAGSQGLPGIVASHPIDARCHGPLVSILLPAFDCAHTLPTTLNSLLDQTWKSLEIIVIDDGSTDATTAVTRRIMEEDSRVRLFANAQNAGAYVARNVGLKEAKGEFITVCDAGDWVHPQRIERQVLDLLSSGHPFNWTQWVRADESMVFHPRTRGLADFVHNNPSSLMFHRAVFDVCGVWDEIRVSGDTEFRTRVQEILGVAPRLVAEGCPLAIAILDAGSLTQSVGTQIQSRYRGVRRDYLDSVSFVRRQADLTARRELRCSPKSPLVVRPPRIRIVRPQTPQSYDVLLVGDFSDSSCEAAVMLRVAERAGVRGSSVGLVHLPSRVGDVDGPSSWSRESMGRSSFEWVHPGDTVTSALTVTTDSLPSWGESPIDEFPNITSRRLWVIGRSRVIDGRFVLAPSSEMQQSLAAYFPRLSEPVRYLGDVAPYRDSTNGWGDLDTSGVPSLKPLKATLLTSLAGGRGHAPVRGRNPSATVTANSGNAVMLLECERCSDGDGATTPAAVDTLAREAEERGLFLVVPTHLHPRLRSDEPGPKAVTIIPRTGVGSLAERLLGPSQAVQGAIYWPDRRSGTPQCWDPISAVADGLPVVGRALYDPAHRHMSSGQPFGASETIGDAFDALATQTGRDEASL